MLTVTIVVGNPKPKSRTAQLALRIVDELFPHGADVTMIDLADHADSVFAWPSELMNKLTARVATSDLAIMASPTYKGAYTGLLKAFLDRYPNLGLSGVVVIPVMTGASLRHSMAPDTSLRPVLVELGATVPTTGMYFVIEDMSRMDVMVSQWVADCKSQVSMHLPAVLSTALTPTSGAR